MKKLLLAPLLVVSMLAAGCGERGQRFWRLVEISQEINNYHPRPHERLISEEDQMEETRQLLDDAVERAKRNLGKDYLE
jgi:hypothetical protein